MVDRPGAVLSTAGSGSSGARGPGRVRGAGGVCDGLLPVLEVLGVVRGEPGQVGGGLVGQRREIVFHRGGPGIVQRKSVDEAAVFVGFDE